MQVCLRSIWVKLDRPRKGLHAGHGRALLVVETIGVVVARGQLVLLDHTVAQRFVLVRGPRCAD